jgi:hypothetical protein
VLAVGESGADCPQHLRDHDLQPGR